MNQVNPDVLRTFLEESEERLTDMESGLLALRDLGGPVDEELIHAIFRDAHSVKAGANLLHLKNIEALAHKVENVLDLIRNGRVAGRGPILTKLLDAVDAIHDMVDHVEESDSMDMQRHLDALTLLCKRPDL